MRGLPLLAAVLAVTLGGSGAHAQSAPSAPPRSVPLTKDRLSEEQFEALVQAPLDLVRGGDLAAGERSLEALVDKRRRRFGPNSLEVADTLHAFGVSLYIQGLNSDDLGLRRRSAAYVARAVPIYRAALGPVHPEVALALTDHADILRRIDPDNPPPEVDVELEESYRIRKAALGMNNVETAQNLASLAVTKGLPSRTGGDPAKVAAAAAMFNEAIEALRRTPKVTGELGEAYFQLATMYLSNGDLASAQATFSAVEAAYPERDKEPWTEFALSAAGYADLLEDRGHTREAEAIREHYPMF